VRPRTKLSHQTFLTRARVSATKGSAHRDLLGMPETFLDELGAALDRFEQSLDDKHNGRAAHVGARAELEAVTAEIMLVVRQLDALGRFRSRNNAESLAAWKSARDVACRCRWGRKSTGWWRPRSRPPDRPARAFTTEAQRTQRDR
jgi:hypothetical protein